MPERNDHSGLIAVLAVMGALVSVLLWLGMLKGPFDLGAGLLGASDHLQRAQNGLQAGSIKKARYETLAASADADRAARGLMSNSPLFDLASLIPSVRDALGQADHLVNAARLSADAAEGTLDIAQNALRGPDKIISSVDPDDPKSDAFIRLDRIDDISKTITEVRAAIEGVKKELSAVDLSKIPHRARRSVRDGIAKATETDDLLADAEAGFKVLPTFLGANGDRNYLIGMQNPAELRGTGGAMLQFALLSIDHGRPKLSKKASTVYDVDKNRQPIDIPLPPDAWYQATIADARRFGNANWSPDWPFSAQLTIKYAAATEPDFPHIDGVLLVDPIVMKDLMPGVGRFRSDKYGVYVTGDTVENYLLYRAYAAKPVPRVRRARLKDVVDDFYAHMLKPDHPSELVRGFGHALSTKHMQIWLADPTEERFIKHMKWDGALDTAKNSDYLDVVQQNVGGNKLDYHSSMTTSMDVVPEGDAAHVETNVQIHNGVFLPQPRWALGNSGPNHRPMVNVYVPQAAQLTGASVQGNRIDLAADGIAAWSDDRPAEHLELGKKVWSVILGDAGIDPPGMPPDTTYGVTYDYDVPGAITTRGGRTVYRLVLQHQPKAHAEQFEFTFTLPDGARSVRARGMKRRGRSVVWKRTLTTDRILEVSWRM